MGLKILKNWPIFIVSMSGTSGLINQEKSLCQGQVNGRGSAGLPMELWPGRDELHGEQGDSPTLHKCRVLG